MSIKSGIIRTCFGLTMLLLFAGVVIVFYLSWLPDPVLSRYNLLPDWLAQWTDAPKNDTLRTAIPFICLGIVTGGYLSVASKNWRWWLSGWAGLTLIVFIAETGQLTLPYRSFDWDDIAWGVIGSLGGLLLTGIVKVIVEKLRYTNKMTIGKE